MYYNYCLLANELAFVTRQIRQVKKQPTWPAFEKVASLRDTAHYKKIRSITRSNADSGLTVRTIIPVGFRNKM